MADLPQISEDVMNAFFQAAHAAGCGAYISGGQGRLEVNDDQVRAGLAAALVASGWAGGKAVTAADQKPVPNDIVTQVVSQTMLLTIDDDTTEDIAEAAAHRMWETAYQVIREQAEADVLHQHTEGIHRQVKHLRESGLHSTQGPFSEQFLAGLKYAGDGLAELAKEAAGRVAKNAKQRHIDNLEADARQHAAELGETDEEYADG